MNLFLRLLNRLLFPGFFKPRQFVEALGQSQSGTGKTVDSLKGFASLKKTKTASCIPL